MSEEELSGLRNSLEKMCEYCEVCSVRGVLRDWAADLRAYIGETDKLIAEIERLRAENEELRQLGADE